MVLDSAKNGQDWLQHVALLMWHINIGVNKVVIMVSKFFFDDDGGGGDDDPFPPLSPPHLTQVI
jgi:hypothetical protein